MARTNSKFFEYSKNLLGATGAPTPIKVPIANSTTIKLGQAIRINTGGYAVPAGVGNPIAGIVNQIVDKSNVPINAFQYDSSKTGHTNSGDDAVVAASDNQSRANAAYVLAYVPLEAILFANDASGDLSQSNLFQLFDLVSTSDQIDQATASDSSGQLQLIQLDPDNDGDLSKGLFRVSEPQLLGQIGNSTAVVIA